jgi:5-methylcytosine-specific restriction endonuclease McrA
MDIVSRKDARAAGLTEYFAGKPCKFGMIAVRTVNGGCQCDKHKAAISDRMKAYYANNSDLVKLRVSIYRAENKEIVRESLRKNYEKFREERLSSAKEYRGKHKARVLESLKQYRAEHREALNQYVRVWRSRNPEYRRQRIARKPGLEAAHAAKRRAALAMATPVWLTKDHVRQIELIYAERDRVTKETGVDHHVDHIIPLRGKGVTGLHVPWNLQVIPAIQNVKKGNRVANFNN